MGDIIIVDAQTEVKSRNCCNICMRVYNPGQEKGISFITRGGSGIYVSMCDDCIKRLGKKIKEKYETE